MIISVVVLCVYIRRKFKNMRVAQPMNVDLEKSNLDKTGVYNTAGPKDSQEEFYGYPPSIH